MTTLRTFFSLFPDISPAWNSFACCETSAKIQLRRGNCVWMGMRNFSPLKLHSPLSRILRSSSFSAFPPFPPSQRFTRSKPSSHFFTGEEKKSMASTPVVLEKKIPLPELWIPSNASLPLFFRSNFLPLLLGRRESSELFFPRACRFYCQEIPSAINRDSQA